MSNFNIKEIENKIGYSFKNPSLLVEAFTHPSYQMGSSYQRLEFFGDSILGFIVAEELFSQNTDDEGELTQKRAALVSRDALAYIVKQLGLEKYVIMGAGQSVIGKKNISDLYESVLAGIYLDGGIIEAKKFVKSTIFTMKLPTNEDDISIILQYYSKRGKLARFEEKDIGNEHKHIFISTLFVDNTKVEEGKGDSKRNANKNCAKLHRDKLKI